MKTIFLILTLSVFSCNFSKHNELAKNNSSTEERFEVFFQKFSSDSIFQKTRVKFPLKYSSQEPEEDEIVSYLSDSDWYYIDFTKDSIASSFTQDAFNVIKNKNKRNQIEYTRQGIDNGIYVKFIFDKIKEKWYLTHVIDNSD